MKIGILSLKYRSNFGGILQSLALQNVLLDMGHQVEIINYSSSIKESFFRRLIFRLSNLLFTKNIFAALVDKQKEQQKRIGKNSPNLIDNCEKVMARYLRRGRLLDENTISEYCKDYDCVIVGSDQIWNVTNAPKLIYFFDWKYSGKKIAYAACCVKKNLTFLNINKVGRLLRNFNSISVRDRLTQDFVTSASGIKPMVVADPTLLYNFDPLLEERLIPESYILTYILGEEIQGGNLSALEKIKSKCPANTKVVAVVIPSVSLEGTVGADLIIDDCDPLKWVNLIKYAEFVFTDSFHGVVFSLKYKKRFITYYSFAKRATRLTDLNERYDIGNVITHSSEIDDVLKRNHIPNYHKIEEHVIESKHYLSKIL